MKLIDTGNWNHSKYEIFLDFNNDYKNLDIKITGAAAICVTENNEVVIINNEPLGGHLENNETPVDTIKREALEEGGFEISKAKYFGFYKITQIDTAEEKYKIKYPKTGLILFFIAKGKIVSEPLDKKAGNRRIIPIGKVREDIEIKHKMLLEGIKLYENHLLTNKF